MSGQYCPYCLSRVRQGESCPRCGRDPAEYRPAGYHLPPGERLKGRYLTGMVLEEDSFGITYLGKDTSEGQSVTVREFFPRSLVQRDHSVSKGVVYRRFSRDRKSVV